MKKIRLLTFVLIIGTLVLSACGAAAATPTAAPEGAKSAKVDAMPVSFVGIVDSIAGDQWVISGTTVTVDEAVVRDGPFNIGDQVKVEGLVHPDGSFTISRVESPTPQEAATLPAVSVENSNEAPINANINDSNVNDANANDGNINDDSSGGVNSNDDNSNDDNSNDSNTNDDNGGGNTNDDNSNSSNDNGDDNGGDRGNDNGDDDNSGKGRGGDDKGGDDKDDNSNDD